MIDQTQVIPQSSQHVPSKAAYIQIFSNQRKGETPDSQIVCFSARQSTD